MHYVEAKGILKGSGKDLGMNIYRGCTHGCIYCDSRSLCYQFTHPFEDIEVKSNAPELLEKALSSKRKKCMIATGSMSDPYMHCEKDLRLTRRCLEIIYEHGFGAAVQTKSDRILDDIDLLDKINHDTKCVVQMTLTTYDDKLCSIIEPNVCNTKRRIEVLEEMQKRVLSRRCWDALENLREIYELAKSYGAAQYLSFDLGLTRSLDYYTGMLFEGYAAGMGYSLIGGGRYDNMMQRFGEPCPATGFALGIDRIALTLERQGSQIASRPETILVAYGEGKATEAIRLASGLRGEGKRTKLASRPMTKMEAMRSVEENHCDALRYVE